MKILGTFPIKFFSPSDVVIAEVLSFGKLHRCHQIPCNFDRRSMLELNKEAIQICIPSLGIPEIERKNLGLSLCIEGKVLCVKVVYIEPTSFLNTKVVVKSTEILYPETHIAEKTKQQQKQQPCSIAKTHRSHKSIKGKKRLVEHKKLSSLAQEAIGRIRLQVEGPKEKSHDNFTKGFRFGGYANSWERVLGHHGSGWECHGGGPGLGKHH